jgi:hypothetical protein
MEVLIERERLEREWRDWDRIWRLRDIRSWNRVWDALDAAGKRVVKFPEGPVHP